jgi:hypothetical protein
MAGSGVVVSVSVARMADLTTKANLQSLQKVTGRFGYGFGMVMSYINARREPVKIVPKLNYARHNN